MGFLKCFTIDLEHLFIILYGLFSQCTSSSIVNECIGSQSRGKSLWAGCLSFNLTASHSAFFLKSPLLCHYSYSI